MSTSRKSFKDSFDRIDRKLQRQQKREIREAKTNSNFKKIKDYQLEDFLEEDDDDLDDYYDDEFL
jgi:hypothetical protein